MLPSVLTKTFYCHFFHQFAFNCDLPALVINALNSIERFTDDETSCVSDEDTGSIEFRFDGIPSHDATLLLDSMILGLEEIEDSNDYEKYIDIIFKEV